MICAKLNDNKERVRKSIYSFFKNEHIDAALEIKFYKTFPTTTTNKIDRSALKIGQRQSKKKVLDLVNDILNDNIDDSDLDSTFREVGFDSLTFAYFKTKCVEDEQISIDTNLRCVVKT
eukprot:UN33967